MPLSTRSGTTYKEVPRLINLRQLYDMLPPEPQLSLKPLAESSQVDILN